MTNIGRYHGSELRGMHPLPNKPLPLTTTGRFDTMFPEDRYPRTRAPQLTPDELSSFGALMREKIGDFDDNPYIPSGFVYLGQFLDHDITFDPTSLLEQYADLETLQNFRTPAFELDSLYGAGPSVSPHLYDRNQPDKFLLDEDRDFDFPRNSQGVALIGDPRNDQNLLIAQLHLAFLKFHNMVYDQVYNFDDGYKTDAEGRKVVEDRFGKAHRLVRWHYQWIILNEFLPLIVGADVVRTVLATAPKKRFYQYKLRGSSYPFIPVEFSAAAYRFGHSQVRPAYRINDNDGTDLMPLFLPQASGDKRQDLRGGRITRQYVVNWKNFFVTGAEVSSGGNRYSKKIDTKLASPLLQLPRSLVLDKPNTSHSLPVRNLQRGQEMGLPSGQEVARWMRDAGYALNHEKDFDERLWEDLPQELREQLKTRGSETPLWYYILKEADLQHKGRMLGDVGGRIVAEVFIGLLEADQQSYRYYNLHGGKWNPTLPREKDDNFTIVDLLRFAGVPTQ